MSRKKKKLKLLKNGGKVSLRKNPTLLLAPHHFVPNGEQRGEKESGCVEMVVFAGYEKVSW